MTAGEWIVVALFGAGVLCSLSLLWWLRKLIRDERSPSVAAVDAAPETTPGLNADRNTPQNND